MISIESNPAPSPSQQGLAGGARGDPAGQYLTFTLGREEYAIPILKVQEIKGRSAVTPIPNTPPWVKGVMNLRGTVVPVVGLREKFGLAPVPYDKFTVIIVVDVGGKTVGVVVDTVSDVMDLPAASIEAPPALGDGTDTSFMTGMAKHGDRLITLLEVDTAIGGAALGLTVGLAGQAPAGSAR